MAVRVVNEYETSRARDKIAISIVGFSCMAMAMAAGYGFYSGNFGGLLGVWTVAGPFIGMFIGYYFHRGRKDGG